jgi:hypothetical protein
VEEEVVLIAIPLVEVEVGTRVEQLVWINGPRLVTVVVVSHIMMGQIPVVFLIVRWLWVTGL